MAVLTPAEQEAIKEPGFSFCNRHFAVLQDAPRKWVVRGLAQGAWPHFWKQTTSAPAAMHLVIREMVKHIEYLNDACNRERKERDALAERLPALERENARLLRDLDAQREKLALDEPRASLARMTEANERNLARADDAEQRLEWVKQALEKEID